MFVVSVDNQDDGYQIFGPFNDAEKAREFITTMKKRKEKKVFLHDLIDKENIM